MSEKRTLINKDLVYIGVLAAMCAIATAIRIPFGANAMIHLGTACLFTVAILFGGVYAGLSAAIGSALFDLVMGFSPYTLWSFFIKGGAGLMAGYVAHGLWPNDGKAAKGSWIKNAFVGCALAASWTLGGYIFAWWQVSGSVAVALANMPSSLFNSGIGVIIALLLAPRLKQLSKRRL